MKQGTHLEIPMRLELVNATTVLVAQQFNPTIVRDHWLIKHGLVAEDDFEGGCTYTDAFVNVQSKEFDLLVVPNQLQFLPKVPPDEQQALLVEKIGAIVEKLPHTPYTGIGLNFTWHLVPEDDSIEALSRRLFFVSENPLCKAFDVEDARFGAYFSKDAFGRRLKLDIKPVIAMKDGNRFNLIQFGFNFHRDIEKEEEESVSIIRDSLQIWEEVRDESKRIMDIALKGGVE